MKCIQMVIKTATGRYLSPDILRVSNDEAYALVQKKEAEYAPKMEWKAQQRRKSGE